MTKNYTAAQVEAIDIADANLNNVCLPLASAMLAKPSMVVEIEVRSVYGNNLIYPVNDAAKALARIAGKKTLSVENIKDACALGLEVVEINRNYEPIANLLKGA